MNGGPLAADLGDGTYFFAVLEPGGQGGNNDPNDGSAPGFMTNLARLPRQPSSVIVRSVFPSGGARTRAGYNSASVTQSIQALLDGYQQGRFRQYWDLLRRRRAAREFGADPNAAQERPASEVEGYLQ